MALSTSAVWQRMFRTRAEDSLPHKISHRRIYIVPSQRGLAFLFALLLMLIASINYALSLGYGLCFLLTGLFASTLLHTYRNVAGIDVQQIQGGDTFAGDALVFDITLANRDRRDRHGINLRTTDARTRGIAIGSEGQLTARLAVPSSQRGVRPLGRLTIESNWPLGLWTCWSYLHTPACGLVFPTPEKNPPPLPLTEQADQGGAVSSSQQGDVAGLREYQPGDSIGSIAWKNAARGLGLQVRTFESESGPSRISLGLQQAGHNTLETQLSRLCAWVLKAEQSSTDYALNLSDVHLDYGHGKRQRLRALRALAAFGQAI